MKHAPPIVRQILFAIVCAPCFNARARKFDQLALAEFTASEHTKVLLGQMSHEQELRNEEAFYTKRLDGQKAALQKILSDDELNAKQREKVSDQITRIEAEAATKRGVRFIDAPVSGGVPRAEDATLAIMVGGDARDVEEARPVLACLGANIIHVGPTGSGEVAKICNNLIAGVAAVAVSEAFRIAEGFGVDPKTLTDVISKSSGNTWVMEHMHPVPGMVAKAPANRDYAPGFMTDLMTKDLGLAVSAARDLRVPVFVAPAAQQVLRLASSHGLGRKDFSVVYRFLTPSSSQAPV